MILSQFFKTSGTTNQITQHGTPQNLHPQQHCCKNHKSLTYCCFGNFKLLPSKLHQISADYAKMAIWCFRHVHCLVVFLLLSKQNSHSQTAEIIQLGGSFQHLYTLTTDSLSCTPTHKIPSMQCSEWSST
jgi:hypothetical protein